MNTNIQGKRKGRRCNNNNNFIFFDKQIRIFKESIRVCLIREFWRGGEGRGGAERGGEIFNLKCLVQFLEGEGREGKGSKSF